MSFLCEAEGRLQGTLMVGKLVIQEEKRLGEVGYFLCESRNIRKI